MDIENSNTNFENCLTIPLYQQVLPHFFYNFQIEKNWKKNWKNEIGLPKLAYQIDVSIMYIMYMNTLGHVFAYFYSVFACVHCMPAGMYRKYIKKAQR